jgi:arylsulfatase A-like enzyme
LHTSEPHQPYLPSEPYRQRFAPDSDKYVEIFERNPRRQIWKASDETISQLTALYDAEIAENDAGFGQVLEALTDAGLFNNSIVIFVSDHGEEFYEKKRWGHGRSMVFEQLNVALAIKFPGQTVGSRVQEAAQHVDILPTILDLLDLPVPSTAQGRSLVGLTKGSFDPSQTKTPIFSHNHFGDQYSVVFDEFKLIQRRRRGVMRRKGLYNWRTDPREEDNLLDYRPITAGALSTLIASEKDRFGAVTAEDAQLDEEILNELRALGYLK